MKKAPVFYFIYFNCETTSPEISFYYSNNKLPKSADYSRLKYRYTGPFSTVGEAKDSAKDRIRNVQLSENSRVYCNWQVRTAKKEDIRRFEDEAL